MEQLGGKRPVWMVLMAMVFAFSAAILIMFRTDPFQSVVFEKIIFLASVFIGMWSLAVLAIFFVRRLWSKYLPAAHVFNASLWQGLLLSGLLIVFLVFKKFLSF